MAEGAEDKEQKTEQPTHRRLEEARKRGQVPFSRELGHFLILFVFALTVAAYVPAIMRHMRDVLTPFLANAQDYDVSGLGVILTQLAKEALAAIIVPLLAAMVVAFGGAFMQNGLVISAEPIVPKWEKLSPKKGFERMFSQRAVVEFLKGLVKITIVGLVCFMAVQGDLGHIRQLPDDEVLAMLLFLSTLAVKLLAGVCIAMFFIALFDLIYQRFDYIKNLRMSKQELKDEYKQQEGDPTVKQRLRQIRTERAKKRMMAAVPGADVVITNPTHYAVALKYNNVSMQAPTVVAKGRDYIALTMRKVAEENQVPIVENPPLARALHDNVEIDSEIPVQHYQAVAEIISYVYRLKGKLPKAGEGKK